MSNLILVFSTLLNAGALASPSDVITLKAGFVKKVSCEGRLYLSAVGNDAIVRLEALPKELGCAVILKPLASSGRTNLILETSVGNITKLLEISGK